MVDHNHNKEVDPDAVIGKVRGLLCNNCNLALGQLRDNGNIALSLIHFLINSKSWKFGEEEAEQLKYWGASDQAIELFKKLLIELKLTSPVNEEREREQQTCLENLERDKKIQDLEQQLQEANKKLQNMKQNIHEEKKQASNEK